MMAMVDHIDAAQEDCKAAREVFRSAGPAICEAIEYGGCEETAIFSIAQAFTRHRLASTAALQAERDALAARVDALEGALKQIWTRRYGDWCEIARDALGEG